MKKALGYNFADHLVIATTIVFAALTMAVWSYISIGLYIIGITALAMCFAIYLSVVKKSKAPVLITLIAYLIFIEIYFYFFRINLPVPGPFTVNVDDLNWGTAFMALIIIWLTPFFIAMNVFDLIANFSRSTK